jgi:LEA14-like dessication related protein
MVAYYNYLIADRKNTKGSVTCEIQNNNNGTINVEVKLTCNRHNTAIVSHYNNQEANVFVKTLINNSIYAHNLRQPCTLPMYNIYDSGCVTPPG